MNVYALLNFHYKIQLILRVTEDNPILHHECLYIINFSLYKIKKLYMGELVCRMQMSNFSGLEPEEMV